MSVSREPRSQEVLQPGDQVELVQPVERQGLKRGSRGVVVSELRYWDQVRVDFGRGRQVPVARGKLKRVA